MFHDVGIGIVCVLGVAIGMLLSMYIPNPLIIIHNWILSKKK